MGKLLSSAALIAAFFVWSCGSNEEKTANTETASSWEFELQDSIQLDILGTPTLADAEFGKILIYDGTGREFILMDQKSGEVLNRFTKKGDSPDNFGFQMTLPGFLDENRIAVIGMPGIFVFDTSGNLIRKHPHPEAQSGGANKELPGGSTQWIEFNEKKHILFRSLRIHDSFQGEKQFYTRYRALEITDPEDGTSREHIPFPSESRFLNGLGYEMPDYEPVFDTDSKEVFLAFGGEPILHRYAITGDSLVWKQSQNLELKNFGEVAGKPLESFESITFSVNMMLSSIRKIAIWKDYVLLHYYSGLSTKEMEETKALFMQGQREEAMALRKKQLEGKSMQLLVLNKSTLEPIIHIDLPAGVMDLGFSLDGENFYFEKAANPDAEEDFIRIYRYQLLQK